MKYFDELENTLLDQIEKLNDDSIGEKDPEAIKAMVDKSRAIWVDCTDEVKQAFQAGAKWGIANAIDWHDLRKNPNDLPKEGVEVLVLYTNTYGNGEYIVNRHTLQYELAQYINDEEDTFEWYWVETGTDDDIQKVIAWCELPQFKDKE